MRSARNRGPDGSYWARWRTGPRTRRRRRPKDFKLVENPGPVPPDRGVDGPGLVTEADRARAANEHPAVIMERVCHETIYQALYVQTRGELRADLSEQLSLKRRPTQSPGQSRRARHEPLPGGVQDQPTPRRGRRPGRARALGRRPDHRHRRTPPRSAPWSNVSTRFTILLHLPGRHDADSRRRGDDPRDGQAARAPAPIDHLGPRHRAGRLPATSRSSWTCRSSSATRTRPGNAAPTRTPTGCCGSGSRRAPTSPSTPPRTYAGSPPPSTPDPALPSNLKTPAQALAELLADPAAA